MIPTIVVKAREAYGLLSDIADRVGDPSPAWSDVAEDIFDRQKRFWLTEYGGQTDKDQRSGRNPAYMEETGGLRRAATVKGAPGNLTRSGRTYLLVAVTHGLAAIHEERGREVLDTPGRMEAAGYAAHVARYILTGRR